MDAHFTSLVDAGYLVRPATYADLPQVVALFNAYEREFIGAGDCTVERYGDGWRQSGIDVEASTRVVMTPDGCIVGVVELWDHFNPPVRPYIWARVHPQAQGRGIGSSMLAWALSTSKRSLDRVPEDVRVAAQASAPCTDLRSIERFERAGMRNSRYMWQMLTDLDRPIRAPQWPAGILVRTLRYPDDLEAAFRAEDEAFRDHWGYVERPFEEAFERWKKHRFGAAKLQPDLWFIATAGDEIAGQVNSQERDDLDASMGWIATVGVRKPYRQRGIGQALLLHAFRELQARGVSRTGLMVDAANRTGATRLYERVGMRVQHEFAHYELELRPGRELAVVD
ncbi:MAG: GNAT family N-acetyltransferase [Caldilineales bacterium]